MRGAADQGRSELARDARAIRRLARALVRDPHMAEDIGQDASLAVLRGPPPAAPARRSWLATVVTNSLRLRLRANARRQRTESAAAQEEMAGEIPSPEALVERARTRNRLAQSVLALDEPYRSTIMLRYYEGLSAAEIARAAGIPSGTVRWRLKVGLDRLRVALDERHGGDRRRWMLLLWPGAVPRRAEIGGALAALGAGGGAVALIAVVAALLGVGRQVAPAGTRAARPWTRAPHFVAPAGLEPDDERRARAPAARGPKLTVSGSVRDADGRGLAGALVVADQLPAGAAPLAQARTDGRGGYHLTVPAGDVTLSVLADGHVRDHLDLHLAGDGSVFDFSLGLAARIHGRVVSPGGRVPPPGSVVHLRGLRNLAVVTTDAGGAFTADNLFPDVYQVLASAGDEAGSLPRPLALAGGARVDDVVVGLARAATVRGRVLDESGQPVAGTQLELRSDTLATRVESDGAGWYRAGGLLPGSYRLSASADGYARARSVVLVDGGAVTADLVLAPEAILVGQVTTADGAPVPGAEVRVEIDGGPSFRTTAGADGRFERRGLPPGRARAFARLDGEESAAADVTLAGTRTLTLALLEGVEIAGTVSRDGAPASDAVVAAIAPAGRVVVARSGPDGRYRLGPLSPGWTAVRAYQPSQAPVALLKNEIRRWPLPREPDPSTRLASPGLDLAHLDLTLPRRGLPLAGLAVEPSGAPLVGARLIAVPLGTASWHTKQAAEQTPYRTYTGHGGAFRIDDLPEGPVALTVELPGALPLTLDTLHAGDTAVTVRYDARRPAE